MPYTPPVAASGGYMVIQYTNGTDTHHMKIHVLPFSLTAFIVGGGTPSVAVDDGNHDYAYTPDRPAGMEAGISDTFQAFVNVLKGAWHTDWVFSLSALYQTVAGVSTQVPVTPKVAPISGSSPNGDAVGQSRAAQETLSFRTAHGGRARIALIGYNHISASLTPFIATPTTGISAVEQAIVGYVSGSATGIVGHDNGKLNAQAHVAFCINRRLRRHYGYA